MSPVTFTACDVPGSHTSATIGDCIEFEFIEFVSTKLPVRHNNGCPTNIPDSH